MLLNRVLELQSLKARFIFLIVDVSCMVDQSVGSETLSVKQTIHHIEATLAVVYIET